MRRARRAPLSLVRDGTSPGPYSGTEMTVRTPTADAGDVLARLASAPARESVTTGTPLDALASDRIARGALVVVLGEPERGKTALALACAAHRLGAGDDVLVHAVDRDPLVAVRRLAVLLGAEPADLARRWPSLRVRDDDLARSVDMVSGGLLVVDSIQTAAQHASTRGDAAPHERVEAVLGELRRAALTGALVVATCERAPSGDARHSHAVGYAADVLAVCERDNAGRFSVEVTKPFGRGLRWYVLHAAGWPVDWTAESPAEQLARDVLDAPKRRPGKRSADNRPPRTPEQIEHDVRRYLAERPDASQRRVVAHVEGRAAVVRDAVRRIRSEDR